MPGPCAPGEEAPLAIRRRAATELRDHCQPAGRLASRTGPPCDPRSSTPCRIGMLVGRDRRVRGHRPPSPWPCGRPAPPRALAYRGGGRPEDASELGRSDDRAVPTWPRSPDPVTSGRAARARHPTSVSSEEGVGQHVEGVAVLGEEAKRLREGEVRELSLLRVADTLLCVLGKRGSCPRCTAMRPPRPVQLEDHRAGELGDASRSLARRSAPAPNTNLLGGAALSSMTFIRSMNSSFRMEVAVISGVLRV